MTVEVDGFLADSVESVGGKLYALGIGWNVINIAQFPTAHPRIGVGLVFRVAYTATNQPHEFSVRIDTEDGAVFPLGEAPPGVDAPGIANGQIHRLGGQINVGRPPDLPHGDSQLVAVAIQLDQLKFDSPGMYTVTVQVDGSDEALLPFRVRQVPLIQAIG